jgi:hypothetical protein
MFEVPKEHVGGRRTCDDDASRVKIYCLSSFFFF